MPEIIYNNITGFLVTNIEEAVTAVSNISIIDRNICHRMVIDKYSKERMTEDYIEVYKKILNI